jgi:hypothetical protein
MNMSKLPPLNLNSQASEKPPLDKKPRERRRRRPGSKMSNANSNGTDSRITSPINGNINEAFEDDNQIVSSF